MKKRVCRNTLGRYARDLEEDKGEDKENINQEMKSYIN